MILVVVLMTQDFPDHLASSSRASWSSSVSGGSSSNSIKVETKEEQKKYKKLFSEISRLYNSEKSEDEIIQFVKVWMGV